MNLLGISEVVWTVIILLVGLLIGVITILKNRDVHMAGDRLGLHWHSHQAPDEQTPPRWLQLPISGGDRRCHFQLGRARGNPRFHPAESKELKVTDRT